MPEKLQNIPTENYNTSPKLSEKKEKAEKAIGEITGLLQGNYKSETPGTKEQKISEFKQINKQIRNILKENGIKIASILPDDKAVRKFFTENGYLAYFSPIEIEGGKFLLNTPIFKVGRVEKFDGSHIQPETGGDFGMSDIHVISDILVPEILTEKRNIAYDGRTIQNPQTGEVVIWFDEKLAKTRAKEANLNYGEYKEGVILNEVSQKYFGEIIPPQYNGVSLAKFRIQTKPNGLKVFHLLEAFSDYTTIKYADDSVFRSELKRMTTTNDYQYKLSQVLIQEALKDAHITNIEAINKEQLQKIKANLLGKHRKTTINTINYIGNIIKSVNK